MIDMGLVLVGMVVSARVRELERPSSDEREALPNLGYEKNISHFLSINPTAS